MKPIAISLRALAARLLVAIPILWSFVGRAVPPPAGVAPVLVPAGGFAIDGDLLANTLLTGKGDWILVTNAPPGTGGGVMNASGLPFNGAITFHFTDSYSGDDLVFKGGYKWYENPNNWQWTTNKASSKTDINNALVHIGNDADGHVWAIVAADRESTSGDAYIDFEFLQNPLVRTNDSGTPRFFSAGPNGGRTTNDVLVSLAFTSGGSVADCFLFQWLPDGNGGFNYTNITASLAPGRIFVALNTNTIPVPYGAFGNTNYAPNSFAEAAVDLTTLLSAFNPCLSIGVRTIMIKTKSSPSDNASMEDFIDPIQYNLRIGPSANAGADQKRCSEGNQTAFPLPGMATAGIFPLVSNIWTVLSGSAVIDSPTSLVTTARVSSASATLRLTVYEANGCTESDDVVLTVAPLPICSITGAASMCPRSSAQFTAPTGMSSYAWSISGNGTISGSSTQATVSVTAGSACGQTFTLTLNVSSNGCSSTCSQEVMVNDTTPPTLICPGDRLLDCPADTRTNSTGVAVAQDGCGPVTVTYSDAITNGCAGTTTISRTWTAIDGCGNSNGCVQMIVVRDISNPVIHCPANVVREYPANTDPSNTGVATATDSCTTPRVSYTDNVTPGCGNTFTILRTWTAVDECGNAASCDQTISVVDTTKPTLVCAGNKTVECTTPWDFDDPTASDTAGNVAITIISTVTNTVGHCGNTFDATRTWRATDDCGNYIECSQKVTIVDTTKPTITCAENKTVECTASWDFDPPTASDTCGNANITIVSTTTNRTQHCGNTFDTTRTWRATDDCGNLAECSQTVTVVDTTLPTITCVGNKTVECTAPWDFDMPTASDTCGTARITIVSTVTNTAGHCGNTFDATRTWRATDDCGNFAECSQTVTIEDTTKPTITCVADKTVECTSVWDFDAPSASDTCGNVQVTIVSTTTNLNDHCGNTFDATRTWRATDDCGNFAECSQKVTVVDTTKPTITCVGDKTVECTSIWDFDAPSASDTCGNVNISIVSTTTNRTDHCGNTFDTTRTWRATDDCGNFSECSQKVTVVDTTKPTISCVGNKSVECTAPWDFDAPTASDTCGNVNVTIVSTATNKVGRCGNTFDATRTWRATDDCGNFAECSQTVTIVDTTRPTITCVPNKTIECTTPWDFDTPTASDTCGNANITIVSTTTNKVGRCGNTFDATRTWRATDDCGNFAECSQKVTVVDTTKPTITCVGNKTVECTVVWNFDPPTASDTCGNVNITIVSTTTNKVGRCGNTFDATRTWRATDDCGNFAECSQKVTVVDTTRPTITCVGNKTVECTAVWDFDAPTASDTCGNVNVTIVSTTTNKTGRCGNTFDTTRTWRATDDCGNFAECSQKVTVVDTTKPTITCVGNKTVECTVAWNFDPPTASDTCGNVNITIVSTTTNKVGRCGNTFDTTRTWRATDDCGNFAECSQKVTIVDTTKPTITCVGNKTVECTSVWDFDAPSASDTCGNVNVTIVSTTTNKTGHCGNTFDTTRTWRATDDCGNFAECSQKVTVVDTTKPTITCVGNKTVECTAAWDFDAPSASDTCGNVNITIVGTTTNKTGRCGNTFDATRTWRATDDCGNFAECSQKVTVVDTTKPTITCVGNKTVECTVAWDFDAPSASDTCGNVNVTIVSTATNRNGHCGNTFDATRTWRATDDCGNFAECSQKVTIVDTTKPTITCVGDKTVECASSWDFDAPSASDTCGTVNVTIVGTTTNRTDHCGSTFDATRTWRATDDCGNFAECSQKVTVVDTTKPTLICPTNVVLECPADTRTNFTGVAAAQDGCGSVTVRYSDVVTTNCGNTRVIARTWTATDECSNSVSCVQTISVLDTIKPTLSVAPDRVLECGDSTTPDATGMATAQDGCSQATVTYNDSVVTGCGGSKVITRTWTATDQCGNSTNRVQMITVRDTTAPTLRLPANLTLQCPADTRTNATGVATATDTCGSAALTYSDVVSNGCGLTRTVLRLWTATDQCGNSTNALQTITVIDTTKPALTCPTVNVQCVTDVPVAYADLSTFLAAGGTASDSCSSALTFSLMSDSGLVGRCPGKVTRVYRVTDACGNFSECTQTINVSDTTPPVLTCPSNVTVECGTLLDPASLGGVTATDNCSTNVSLTYSDSVVQGNYDLKFYVADPDTGTGPYGPTYLKFAPGTLPCPDSARLTGRALDPLRNAVAYSTNGALDALTSIGNVPMAFGQIVPFEVVIQASGGPGLERGTIEFTAAWSTYTTSNNRFGYDTNYMVYCAFVDAADPGSIDPNNNARVESYSSVVINPGTIGERIQGTFRVSGLDNGDRVVVEIWMVLMSSMPDHTGGTVAADLVSAQKASVPPVPISLGAQTDSLGNLSKITALPPPQQQPPLGPLPPQPPALPGTTINVIDRSWTATDDCGNQSTCVQRITVRDTMPPMLNVPADRLLQYPAVTGTGTNVTGVATAPDACGGSVVITYSDSVTNGCGVDKVIARRWTAIDQSGNSTNAVQTIAVRDMPAITCPPDALFECPADTRTNVTGVATAQDALSPVVVGYSDVVTPGCGNTRVIARTWSAANQCGNIARCVQTIRVVDTTKPTIACAANKTVDGSSAWTFDPPNASDTCGAVIVQILSTVTNVVDEGTSVATRAWSAVDLCGNSNTCQQAVTVVGAAVPPPVLEISCLTSELAQIRWPSQCVGFQLEATETFGSGNWIPVPGTPVVNNGFFTTEVPVTWPPKFYRLHRISP